MDWGDVVVTGGAGAIGHRLVRRLLRENVRRLVVVDDFSSGFPWLLPEDPRLDIEQADVCDISRLGLLVSRPYVFHLAALFANQNSVEHPMEDLRVNGAGTLNTLLWAVDSDAKRLVYASAGCTIAGHDIEGPINERMAPSLHHTTPYQITKLLGELYCNYLAPRLETVSCRFFNVYGPGEVPGRYRNVIPNFIWRASRGEPMIITGDGEETRDFIFVDDLVEGLLLAAKITDAAGMAFNLGTGRETRILELARQINLLCGNRSDIRFGERRAWDRSRRRQAEVSLARDVLGFQASTGLLEGLEATVGWFSENQYRINEAMEAHR